MPLEQMATLSYGLEAPLIWRRQRLPTITVQADTTPGVEAPTVVKSLGSEIAAFKSKLPAGYDVVAGGTVEESAKAQGSVFAVFPLMLFLMITVLMLQLQSFQRLFLVVATGPLAVIGVAAALLVSGAPMGFVAILGVISLVGMVIRNSVISCVINLIGLRFMDDIATRLHARHPKPLSEPEMLCPGSDSGVSRTERCGAGRGGTRCDLAISSKLQIFS